MNRIEFERRLEDAVADRNERELQRLQQLSESAPELHPVWSDHAHFAEVTATWSAAVPDVDLTDRVLHELGKIGASQSAQSPSTSPIALLKPQASSLKPFSGPRIAVAVCLAAVLSIAVIPAFRHQSATEVAHETGLAHQSGREIVTQSATDVEEFPLSPGTSIHVESLLAQASRVPSSWARSAALSMTNTLSLVPASAANTIPEEPGDALPPSVLDRWGRNLEPIGRDVSKAVGFLFDAVPADEAPAT